MVGSGSTAAVLVRPINTWDATCKIRPKKIMNENFEGKPENNV
jgi:hypothetical protein